MRTAKHIVLTAAALWMLGTACSGSSGNGDGGLDGGRGDAGNADAALPPPLETVRIDAVQEGACVTPVDDSTFVFQLNRYDCSVPHAAEVAGRYVLEDADYPGASRLRFETQEACRPIFEAYVGKSYWTSVFDLKTVSPSPSTWRVGDRTVLCLVVGQDGASLTAAAKDSAR